jgi:hypothetical protein
MRKIWLGLAIPLIAMSGLPRPASAAGAMVVGFIPDGRFAWSARDRTDLPNASAGEIENAAIAECKRQAQTANATGATCKIVLHYDNQCAAIASSQPSGHYGGWASATQMEEARSQALQICADSARGSGESCKLISSFCDR